MSKNKKDKKKLVEQMWLDYFNRVLLEKGVITKEEYQCMAVKILARNRSINM